MISLYVEPFAGAAAVALQLLGGPRCHPPVSWMGGKRRLAPVILGALGLRAGEGAGRVILNDAGPWGWVWPALLDPATAARVAAVLRDWRDEPIQALWFRLRDEGPLEEPAAAVAQWLVLQARSASGAPVFWAEDGDLDKGARPGREREAAGLCGANHPTLLQGDRRPGRYYPAWQNKVPAHPLLQGSGEGRQPQPAGQRNPTMADPKLVASDGRGVVREAGIKGDKRRDPSAGGCGGLVRIETLAERVEALAFTLGGKPIEVIAGRAEDLPDLLPRDLTGAAVYLDPPYRGCTGYGWDVERGALCAMAEEYARRGARVAISEAASLAGELGAGWTAVDVTIGRKAEWLTC